MTPDEWTEALHAESGYADPAWARQARRLAWRRRRAAELGEALTRRPLSRLVIVSWVGYIPFLVPLLPGGLMPLFWQPLQLTMLPGLSLLLLVVWQARYVQLGYAPWALAAIATLWQCGLWLIVAMSSDGPPEAGLGHWIVRVLWGALLVFGLLTIFGWAMRRVFWSPPRQKPTS